MRQYRVHEGESVPKLPEKGQARYRGMALTVGGNLQYTGGGIFGNTIVGGTLSAGLGASFIDGVQIGGNLNTDGN